MIQPLRASFFPCLVLLLTLAGCAGLTGLEKPAISLADIQVVEMKTLETTFLVELRVTNPNPDPLTVQGLNCDLELEGKQFASGAQQVEQTIPAYGSTLVEMEVYASVIDMFSSVLGVLQQVNEPGERSGKPIGYRLKGKVRVKSGGFAHTLPFISAGELKL